MKLNKIFDQDKRKKLLNAASSVAKNAYAPYSKFRVGAAVMSASGHIYKGVNIENSSFGLGTCAERVALAAAIAAGERDIVAIAIACIDADTKKPLEYRLPCGACRQWIHELARNADILILGEDRSFSIGDFLPFAFSLDGKE